MRVLTTDRHLEGSLIGVEVVDQDAELVAAEACRDIGFAQFLLQVGDQCGGKVRHAGLDGQVDFTGTVVGKQGDGLVGSDETFRQKGVGLISFPKGWIDPFPGQGQGNGDLQVTQGQLEGHHGRVWGVRQTADQGIVNRIQTALLGLKQPIR